jgi:Ribosomal RNA methyltransferase (FmrO)
MMDKEEILNKIIQKKQFSMIPKQDVIRAFDKFDKDRYSDEEKIKFTRDLLRKTFSGFSGQKLLVNKERSNEEVLKRHLSTKERYPYYEEVYNRILKNLPKKISIIDLGAGVNGLSYSLFKKIGKEVNYIGIEAVGQLVTLINNYFVKEKINGKMIHLSLFDLEKVKEVIADLPKPKIIFLFKVIDSLEKVERDYTKKFLEEIVPISDRIIISFATESWMRRKKFYANRKWLIDFIKENWQFIDDFEVGGERYLVFQRQ